MSLNHTAPSSPTLAIWAALPGCARRMRRHFGTICCAFAVYNIRVGWLCIQIRVFLLVPSLLAEICMFVCSQIDRSAGSQTQFPVPMCRGIRGGYRSAALCNARRWHYSFSLSRPDWIFALFRIIINRRCKYRCNKTHLIYWFWWIGCRRVSSLYFHLKLSSTLTLFLCLHLAGVSVERDTRSKPCFHAIIYS